MSAATITNPPVPFRQRIGFTLEPGAQFYIAGSTYGGADRFVVNLEMPNGNVALHVSTRFRDRVVVRNTQRGGAWEQEERHGGFPINAGTPFQLMILVEEHEYKLAFNGQHFTGYRHRLPRRNVQFLVVEGEVMLQNIMMQPATAYPAQHHHHQPQPPLAVMPVYNPPIPYNQPIGGQFGPHRMIRVSGMPHSHPQRFSVNLVCGPGFEGGSDIALHFDVRFNYGSTYNTIVRTSRSGGGWQAEEKGGMFPFYPNSNFDMMILNDGQFYKVAVNNQHLLEFRHRMSGHAVSHLNITGDVTVNCIQFQ